MEELLPAELMIDILSRLPVKTIIHCKLVCKRWRSLVLDSFFVNLHLSRSPPTGLIIHQSVYLRNRSIHPGILKWVEIEDKVDDHHHLHHMSLDLNMIPVFRNSQISQMGSVNGLICLWQNTPKRDNTYICNPITREILILHTPAQYHKHTYCKIIAYGFGVGSLTGEYKVVRTLNREIRLSGNTYKLVSETEVYTLGTGQWRSLGRLPYRLHGSHGQYLNDHCHWIVSKEEDAPERICTFDLSKETFQLFPSPPSEENCIQSLAVLKGCLCKSYAGDFKLTIWVMKEYGIKNSWHKEVVITEAITKWPDWPYLDHIYLIEGLKDLTILLVSGKDGSLFAFYPRNNRIEEIETFDWLEGWLAYRPSFLKLQNFELETVHMF